MLLDLLFRIFYVVEEEKKKFRLPFILMVIGTVFIFIPIIFFALTIISLVLLSRTDRSLIRLILQSSMIGFLFEEIGIHTGIPFGRYVYDFPPYILGVPIMVIIAWGVFSFISALAVSVLDRLKAIILFPVLMSSIDLSIDPIMVHHGFWRWITTTSIYWFGIPFTNYLGWFLVSLVISLTYFPFIGEIRIKWKYFPLIYPIMMMSLAVLTPSEATIISAIISIAITIVLYFLSNIK